MMSKYSLILSILFVTFFYHSSAFTQQGVEHWTIENNTSQRLNVMFRAYGCFGVDSTGYNVEVSNPDGSTSLYRTKKILRTLCNSVTLEKGGSIYYTFPPATSGKMINVHGAPVPFCKQYTVDKAVSYTINDKDIGYKKGPYTRGFLDNLGSKCGLSWSE